MVLPRRLLSSIVLLGVFACTADRTATGPMPEPPARPSFQTINEPPVSLTLTPVASNQDIPATTVVSYAAPTLVTVQATGLLDMSDYYGNSAGQLDASGVFSPTLSTCTAHVRIAFNGGFVGFCSGSESHPPQDSLTTTVVVQGDGAVGWVSGPSTSETYCGQAGQPPCYTFTGSHTVTITPPTLDFTVTANPATVNYGDSVTVTVTVAPAQVNGVNVPWQIDSTTWAPAYGTQASPCLWNSWTAPDAGTRTCRRPFTRSGTVTVFATVNGVKAQGAVEVTVTPPQLTVTASPDEIRGPQHVTFTATVTPSSVSWRLWRNWVWRPDRGTGGIDQFCTWQEPTCTRTISKSGWMKAIASLTAGGDTLVDSVHVSVDPPVLKVTASPKSIAGPQSVTFTATLTPPPAVSWALDGPWVWRPDSGTGGSTGCARPPRSRARGRSRSPGG